MTCFFFFSSCIVLLLGSFRFASAYPTGAGTCESGPAVLYSSSPHIAKYGNGTLADGGYTTSFINGTYILKAKNSANYFKGFLLRLSSNDTSAAGAFTLMSKYSNVTQLMESTGESVGSYGSPATCDTAVSGISHLESSEKTKIAVKLSLQEGFLYSMMVTVVKTTDEWYYSEELLPNNFVVTSRASTSGPTHSSTSTFLPTPTPVSTPTSGSTTATNPTPKPTSVAPAPVAAPSNTSTASSSLEFRFWNTFFLCALLSIAWVLM